MATKNGAPGVGQYKNAKQQVVSVPKKKISIIFTLPFLNPETKNSAVNTPSFDKEKKIML